MDPVAKDSLLRGVVAFLAFLVLLQGYEIVAGESVAWGIKFGVALLVGAGGAVLAHLLRRRLAEALR